MTAAFQPNAFQSDAFQEHGGSLAGAITGGLSYVNNNDSFSGSANLGASAVTGGWPEHFHYRRRKKVVEQIEPEAQEVTAETVEAGTARVQLRMELRAAERRSREVTAQIRILMDQRMSLESAILTKAAILQEDEEIAMILALAS
jgi:hypothetical protein